MLDIFFGGGVLQSLTAFFLLFPHYTLVRKRFKTLKCHLSDNYNPHDMGSQTKMVFLRVLSVSCYGLCACLSVKVSLVVVGGNKAIKALLPIFSFGNAWFGISLNRNVVHLLSILV